MRKLNGMAMTPNQDPDEYLTDIFRQRDELEHIGESFAEARILDIIPEDLSDEYEPIRFSAEREPEISLKEIEIAMRNMYANRVACGDCSTFSREKGRESAMTASSGFKGSCDYCTKPGHKQAQCFTFFCESGGGPLPSSGAGEAVGVVCITPIFTTTLTATLSSNTVATATAVATQPWQPQQRQRQQTPSRRRLGHGPSQHDSRCQRHVFAYSNRPCPDFSDCYCPIYSGCCPACSIYFPTYSGWVRGCSYAGRQRLVSIGGIGFLFLADCASPGPFKFTMTSDCGASSHFVYSNLIGDIESRITDIVKLGPPATIVVAGHSTLRGVSMGSLTVRVTDAQEFLHDMLLPAMNGPGSRPRACPEGQLPNGSSVPNKGHLRAHNTAGVGSDLSTSQERRHGSGHPSRNSDAGAYRNIYGSVRSFSATDYSFSLWRVPDQWWHHGGGFYFHTDFVFRGAHDFARAGKCYHYRYTGVADNCRRHGGERASTTSARSIRTSASPTTTATTARPQRLSSSSARTTSRAQRPQRTRRAYDHGRGPVHAKRSCTTEVSSGGNRGQCGVFAQPPAKQDHWR